MRVQRYLNSGSLEAYREGKEVTAPANMFQTFSMFMRMRQKSTLPVSSSYGGKGSD